MEITSFDRGPMLGYHLTDAVRFCNDECIKHYRFHRCSSHTQIKKCKLLDSTVSHRHFLSIFCGLLGSNLERNKVTAHFFYEGSQKKRVYALLQIRFVPRQKFLAFDLSNEYLPATCLPTPTPLTDEDKLIVTGLQTVIKRFLTAINFSDLSTCASSILEMFSGESLELPPLQPSLNTLPDGFKISEEDKNIIFPHSYCTILHKVNLKENCATYFLADLSATAKDSNQFLVLFYQQSVDCTIKAIFVVEDSCVPITANKLIPFESKHSLSTYDKLIADCCKQMVCVEVMSMLLEKEIEDLDTFIANYE